MINIDVFEIAKWVAALGTVAGVAIGIGKPLYKTLHKLNAYLDQVEHLVQGVNTMLKYRIQRIGERAIRQGWISSSEMATVKSGYESYQKLGGNGEITILVDMVNKLEVRYITLQDLQNGHDPHSEDVEVD